MSSTPRILTGPPENLPKETFLEILIISLQKYADNVIFENVQTKKNLTYREMHEQATLVAHQLKRLGVKNGDSVTFISHVTNEAFIFMFGVWLAGAATACLNPNLTIDELKQLCLITRSEVFYVGEDSFDEFTEIKKVFDWEPIVITPNAKSPSIDAFKVLSGKPSKLILEVEQPLGHDHVIAILFTSGTTGIPKGVNLRDEAVKFNGSLSLKDIQVHARPMTTSPLYWISSMLNLSSIIASGYTLIVTDRPSNIRILEIIQEYKPTHWFTGPSVLIEMCYEPDLDKYDLSSIKYLLVGGYPVYPHHRKLICEKLLKGRNRVVVGYGSTEGGMVSMNKEVPDPDSPQYASIGQIRSGVLLKITDPETGKILPPYEVGEICVKSPGILRSYINKALTEDELDKDGFWHMGDLGYYDEEEHLYYHSRSKEIMKYNGLQISPAELEELILRLDGVLEVGVAGKVSEVHGELPTAFVVTKPGSTITEQEIADFVASHAVDQKKLRGGVYFVDSLPKSTVGKLLRRELLKKISA